MEDLMTFLRHHNIEEFELAVMIYAYLFHFGETDDLLNDICNQYFKGGELNGPDNIRYGCYWFCRR
jgi:hypothetical protein